LCESHDIVSETRPIPASQIQFIDSETLSINLLTYTLLLARYTESSPIRDHCDRDAVADVVAVTSGSQLISMLQGEDALTIPNRSANETLHVVLGLTLLKIIELVCNLHKTFQSLCKRLTN